MFLEQRIKELLPPAEIRIPKTRDFVGHADHATIGSQIENAEGSADFESLFARDCRTPAVINENEVSRKRQPSAIADFSPSSSFCSKASSVASTTDTSKFIRDDCGDEYLLEQSGQKFDVADLQ